MVGAWRISGRGLTFAEFVGIEIPVKTRHTLDGRVARLVAETTGHLTGGSYPYLAVLYVAVQESHRTRGFCGGGGE